MRHRAVLALTPGLAALLVAVGCLGGSSEPEIAGPTGAGAGVATPTVRPTQAATESPADSAAGHRVAAREANDRGDWVTAIEEYTLAIEIEPAAASYVGRAFAHGNSGPIGAALDDLTEAIALDDQVAAAYSQRALYYNRLGLWERAATDLDRAIELRPERADQYNGRALANLNLGNCAQVVADMDAALALSAGDDPLLPIYLSNRASAYVELGELELALADLDRSFELDPSNLTTVQNRLTVLIRMGRIDEARAGAEAAVVEMGLPGAASLLMSDLFRELGLLDEAIEEIEHAIELDRGSPLLRFALGFTYAQLGDAEWAGAAYEAARELTSDPTLLADIEAAIEELGDY